MSNLHLQPEQLCKEFEREYPDVYRRLEFAREYVNTQGVTWPDWCHAPVQVVEVVTRETRIPKNDLLAMADAGRGAALAAWRMGGKHILRFHDEVILTLWNTPTEDEVPTDVLMHFPFWCAYIPFPYPDVNPDIWGMFVHLNYNITTNLPEIWFTFHFVPRDSDLEPLGALIPIALDLDKKRTVDESIELAYKEYLESEMMKEKVNEVAPYLADLKNLVARGTSVALYVCAENAKMTPTGDPTTRPLKRKGKLFAPNKPNVWEVAYRIGAAINAAKTTIAKLESTSTGRAMRPHMRRAHWHTFRRGRGRVESILHWLPPIPVNIPEDIDQSEWADLLPTTVRPVK